jgi:hypothetical protein
MTEVENIKLEEWLNELKPYQKNSIDVLIKKFGEEKAAEIWITSNGPSNNVPFGGVSQSTQPFYDKFKYEFQKFICGHPDYEAHRKKLGAESPIVKTLYISMISSAIGATIGFSATLLAPAVAILLSTVGQMGLNAYCAGIDLK